MAEGDTLEALLGRVRHSCDNGNGHVSLADVVQSLGPRAYGPLLVVLGLAMVSPIGDIPGASALLGLVVALLAAQLFMRRQQPWLPRWLLRRTVRSGLVRRSTDWLRRPARFVDRHLHPRLRPLTGRTGVHVIAMGCVLVALLLVPLEFMPGASTVVGSTLVAFGMALTTHDGLAALVAFAFTIGTFALLIWQVV